MEVLHVWGEAAWEAGGIARRWSARLSSSRDGSCLSSLS